MRVRGLALAERTYYRLDGEIPPGQRFRWDLAQVAKLAPRDLGVYGYLPGEAPVYVPLAVNGGGGLAAWVLGQQRSERYAEARWRVARMDGGHCGPMPAWQALAPPALPGEPLEIPLPAEGAPAFCLAVAVLPERGGGWRQETWRIRTGP